MNHKCFSLITFLFMASCWPVIAQPQVLPAAEEVSTDQGQSMHLFFFGDLDANPSLESSAMATVINQASELKGDVTLLMLGGHLYPKGLSGNTPEDRQLMENRLRTTLDGMDDFPGKKIMIPGVQDWASGHRDGLEAVKELERYVSTYTGDSTIFYPKNGCPGPEEIALSGTVTLVIVDSQYFLHRYDKGREAEGCGAPGSSEAFALFEEIMVRNQDKHVIVAGHHPMFPNAKRASMKAAGGTYTSGPRYHFVKKAVVDLMADYEHVVSLNAHDFLLQHVAHEQNHYVTSGSITQSAKIKSGDLANFSSSSNGFGELEIDGGKVTLRFYDLTGEVLYEAALYDKEVRTQAQNLDDRPAFDGYKSVPASTQYTIKDKAKFWLGENYRTTWSTPINIPVFDIMKEKGGLQVIKKGGGMQTTSIRLEARDGTQYTLRSIEKNPKIILPRQVRETFAGDFLQDQISSSHPYGAIAVPKLADAAGIYHTNPKLVYVPSDPAFGEYQFLVADKMFLFEERPTKEAAHETYFGEGKKIKGTPDLLEKELYKDNDNWVDQKFVLKSRLFDMFIGDWDRHDDQWRWVGKKEGSGYRYRPIPRDRDQAFFVTSGVLPRIGASKWALPSSEGFDEKVDWAPGFNWNMRWFDRTFLNQPDWEDWQAAIDELQDNIAEEDMRTALEDLPDEVEDLSSDRIVSVLKVRLANMETYARDYYEYLSKEVEVIGSNKHEHFQVTRKPDGQVHVWVRKMTKEGDLKQTLYDRTFDPSVTREIRLYGLGNDDVFQIEGNAKKSIRIRVIGGAGMDKVTDESRVSGMGKKTKIYDTPATIELNTQGESSIHLSDHEDINAYNRKEYKYNIFLPLVSLQYNPDLGFFLGGGFFTQRFKWRKQPFGSQHLFLANAAIDVRSYNFNYQGRFTDVFGKWAVDVKAQAQQPFFITNFFGLGNETTYDIEGETVATTEEPIDFYRLHSNYGFYRLGLQRYMDDNNAHSLSLGAGLRTARIEEGRTYFLETAESGIDLAKVTDRHLYHGFDVSWQTDARNNSVFPTKGFTLDSKLEWMRGMNDRSENLTRFTGSFSMFNALEPSGALVLGNRIGVDHLFNRDFEFFNAAQLGGWSNLRGFRRNRFSGQTAFYHNLDLRLKLFSFSTYLFPGNVGVLAFHDIGRVWLDGESSSTWHLGRGFGVYVSPLNLTAISVNWGFTEEENLLIVKLGFFF